MKPLHYYSFPKKEKKYIDAPKRISQQSKLLWKAVVQLW